MTKYYAREKRSEWIDWCLYVGDGAIYDMKMWIGGNSDYTEINHEMYKEVESAMDCYYEEWDDVEGETIREKVGHYFKPENRDIFTDEEIEKITRLIDNFYNGNSVDEVEIIADMLSIIKGKEFKSGIMRGCCQRDYIYYICPVDVSDKELDYIEAVYFGTGTEYEVTEEKIESAGEFDSTDTTYYYTAEYCTDKVKEDLARQIGYGCTAEDIVLLEIKEEHHYTTYDYEEV